MRVWFLQAGAEGPYRSRWRVDLHTTHAFTAGLRCTTDAARTDLAASSSTAHGLRHDIIYLTCTRCTSIMRTPRYGGMHCRDQESLNWLAQWTWLMAADQIPPTRIKRNDVVKSQNAAANGAGWRRSQRQLTVRPWSPRPFLGICRSDFRNSTHISHSGTRPKSPSGFPSGCTKGREARRPRAR